MIRSRHSLTDTIRTIRTSGKPYYKNLSAIYLHYLYPRHIIRIYLIIKSNHILLNTIQRFNRYSYNRTLSQTIFIFLHSHRYISAANIIIVISKGTKQNGKSYQDSTPS